MLLIENKVKNQVKIMFRLKYMKYIRQREENERHLVCGCFKVKRRGSIFFPPECSIFSSSNK